MITVLKWISLLFLFSTNLCASDSVSPWYALDANKQVTLKVEIFESSSCPHCQKADPFINLLALTRPDIEIHRNIINQDIKALERFNQFLRAGLQDDFVVPTFFFCDSRWAGFISAETTGTDLLHAMDYCKQKIMKNGILTSATVETLRHWAYANRFSSLKIDDSSMMQHTLFLAIADACSPCAFFCFAGFLAFLFVESECKKQIRGGLLYIFSVGLTHYYQQVYTNSFNEMLPWFRIPAVLIGLLALYFVVQLYKKQSNKALYYSLAFLLGLSTNVYQQTCVLNWSNVFNQWLHHQPILNLQVALIQLCYQFLYVLPLLLILIIYVSLLRLKRVALWQPRFFIRGLLFLVTIALFLIIYPMFLSHFVISAFLLFLLSVCGRFINLT